MIYTTRTDDPVLVYTWYTTIMRQMCVNFRCGTAAFHICIGVYLGRLLWSQALDVVYIPGMHVLLLRQGRVLAGPSGAHAPMM